MLGHWEILVVLVVALLLFGHRIPAACRALGQSVSEFKKGISEPDEDRISPVRR